MRSSRLLSVFATATSFVLGGAAALSCSADGAGGEVDASIADPAPASNLVDASPPGPDATLGAKPRDAGPDARDAAVDARGKDAALPLDGAVRDAAVEAGPPDATSLDAAVDATYDPEGSFCAPENTVQERQCGRCGVEKRLCWPGDGGATWLLWGPCQAEKADAGFPNTVDLAPCELCGTKPTTWDNQCRPTVGFCEPAPGSQCERGVAEFASGLSCSLPQGRNRTCDSQCRWEPFSECADYVNPNRLTVADVVDAGTSVVTGTFQFAGAPRLKRLVGSDSTCPLSAASFPQADLVVNAYVEVRNTTTQTATVSLWHSEGNTQMAVYSGNGPLPVQDAERRACMSGTRAADTCPTSLAAMCSGAGRYSTAGMVGVSIPAGGSITVWNSQYAATAAPGPFALSVRTDALN